MQQFIEFSLRHWELWLAFFIILILLLTFELHAKLTGTLPLTVQEAIFKINREDAIFLDIRDVLSFKKGHIAESINIPVSELKTKLNELDSYRERPIIINYSHG
ncbi:MAG: rhodanese-like domain-containing protein, partial [Candidatus Rickettsiella isopodorum]